NPVSVKVTVYVPGRKSMMRYCPVPSVTPERTFSINAGLDASTVTPGNTAPEVSLTVPVMLACAYRIEGHSPAMTKTINRGNMRRIATLLFRVQSLPTWAKRQDVCFQPSLDTGTGTKRIRRAQPPSVGDILHR